MRNYLHDYVFGLCTILLMLVLSSYDKARTIREISLSNDILPAWNKECMHCHGGEDCMWPRLDSSYAFKSLSNTYFVEANYADSSSIVCFLKTHPDTTLSLTQQIYLRSWINQGAKDN